MRTDASSRCLSVCNPLLLATPEALNRSLPVDFVHDALICSHRFRWLNIVNDFNRKVLSIEVDLNLPAQQRVRIVDRIAATADIP